MGSQAGIIKQARNIACLVVAVAALAADPLIAVAQPAVGIAHQPPRVEELPLPGQPLTLSATVKNSRETEFALRTLISVDGQLMDLPDTGHSINIYDEAVYSVEISAPLAEISYEFILFKGAEPISRSPRYTVRRTCTPRIELSDLEEKAGASGIDQLGLMVKQSKNLEVDILRYQRVLTLIDELKRLLKE